MLGVEKPGEGFFEAELYSLPPENFYLDAIEFSDDELAALSTALLLLTDGGFAYAEPLRLALQQVAWGHPNPLNEGERAPVEMAMTASAGGRDLSQRLSKIETAISRRKTIEFTYYTMERGETEKRKVDPYHLVFRGGQFYLIGHSHERDAVRVFRLSRIQGKVGYASKAEHDFSPPENFDRRDYGSRADWQLGETQGTAKIFIRERIAWLIERDFGTYGELREAKKADGAPGKGRVFETDYASAPRADRLGPALARRTPACSLPTTCARRPRAAWRCCATATRTASSRPKVVDRPLRETPRRPRSNGRGEAAIRPERFARLVTLAGLLIEAAKKGERLQIADLRQRLELTDEELREDVELLNVVNFGGGTYVLYAEFLGDEIEVDSEPYGDNFARPARLLPLEAKALVAAIDLFGDHLPQSDLQSARAQDRQGARPRPLRGGPRDRLGRRRRRRGRARMVNDAIAASRVLELSYYKENEDQFTDRRVEPYRLENGREGWYVECYDLTKGGVRHFKLDRIKEAERLRGGLRAAAGGRGAGRGRGLDDPRRGADRRGRPRLGLARARPLAARGAHRGRGAGRRRRRRRASLRGQALAGAGDPARRRRPRRARARGRARGDRQRGLGLRSPRRGPRLRSHRREMQPSIAHEAPGHPEVARIVAPNPGPMTLEGTNTYLYGAEPCAVIDPGPDDPGHLDAIRAAAAERGRDRRSSCSPTPTATTRTAPRSSAPRSCSRPAARSTPACGRSPPPATPPTTSASSAPSGVCFAGDLVLGLGSTIVPPGGGSLAAYMDSLRAAAGARRSS